MAVVAAIILLLVSVSWLSFLLVGGLVAVAEIYLANVKPPSGGSPTAGTGPVADMAPSEHQPVI